MVNYSRRQKPLRAARCEFEYQATVQQLWYHLSAHTLRKQMIEQLTCSTCHLALTTGTLPSLTTRQLYQRTSIFDIICWVYIPGNDKWIWTSMQRSTVRLGWLH
jgi:hypothetical protein